ncbi:MalM family protein [Vibrio pelagius]|uniref:MalM family protein n=1 Tax=Vibrio pelagius TaxID=28169 RepID=UPI0021C3A0DD|nr:MalM family protein [Vibrio pelagius]
MKLKPLATLFMALSLGACSGLPEQTFNTDLSQPQCCSTLDALPLTALPIPFHQQVVMDANLPSLSNAVLLFSDSSKPLPVMSYQITSDSPFSLLVRSYVDNQALFAASVLVYNENWQLVSRYSAQDFEYHPTGMRGLERIEKVITINPQLNGAQYIVLASDSSMLGQKLARQHPEQVYTESQNIIGSKQLPLVAEYQAFGVVEVTTSASNNSAVLTLLTELGTQTKQKQNSQMTPSASPEALDEWEVFQSQIDKALENNDVQQAAALANQASQQGYTQAKDYLVEQLAK